MRPTIRDVNFHFSYAHSAIFSLPLQKKLKEGSISFHRRNLNFLAFGYRKFFFANYNWNNNGSWVPCMGLMGACNRSWSALKVSTISDLFFCFAWLHFGKFFHSKHWLHPIKSSPLHFNEKTWKGGIMWAGFTRQKVCLPLKVSNFLSSHFHMRTVQFFLCH